MKKYFVMLAILACIGTTSAQEQIIANDVEVVQGGQGLLTIDMQLLAGHDYVSYQLKVELPEGISLVADAYGNAAFSLPESQPAAVFKITDFPASNGILKVASSPSTAIAAHEGTLVTIPVQADESLPVGTKLTGRISGVVFAHADATAQNFSDATFEIEISDRILLNESYTWTPYATDAACDLKVARTIKANEWSTICFPFAMSADKLKAAFGDDYDLEEFTGYEVEKDGDNVVGITMQFTKNTKAAKINTPYIIKTTRDISEFEVNAKVNPGNTKKSIVIEDDETGEEVEIASMTGTFVAGTVVPKHSLFLSENKFYYSVGKTKMKAFRAYFTLSDVLSDVSQAAARVHFLVEGETTGIKSVDSSKSIDNSIYDLQGRRVVKPGKGLYIKNGRKEVVR